MSKFIRIGLYCALFLIGAGCGERFCECDCIYDVADTIGAPIIDDKEETVSLDDCEKKLDEAKSNCEAQIVSNLTQDVAVTISPSQISVDCVPLPE